QVWQAATGKLSVVLRGHTDQVSSVSFSPNGHWIMTGSDDQTGAIWNAQTGAREAVLVGHGDSVRTTAFSGNGRWLLTSSDDGTARLWRIPAEPATSVIRFGRREADPFFNDRIRDASFSA